jgi:hypothetical protein
VSARRRSAQTLSKALGKAEIVCGPPRGTKALEQAGRQAGRTWATRKAPGMRCSGVL